MNNNIKLLDCTLRDGGHVNNAEFGYETIKEITYGLNRSGIDYVELGFLKDGVFTREQSSYNDVCQIYPTLPMELNSTFSVMIRPDWYDIGQLSDCDGRISVIRFAFYYKDIQLLKRYCHIARKKGYEIICNPVNIMGYTDKELIELVKQINDIYPAQMTMVDTYGSMDLSSLNRIYGLIENHLEKDIRVGLHLHENMCLSYGLVQEFLKIKNENRKAVIDGSLYGMGRIPGNLCIEVVASHFNDNYKTNYDINVIYDLIERYIEPIKKNIPWGYSPAYFITGKLNMHRSYAEYLLKCDDLRLADINNILNEVSMNERKLFNKAYIESLYMKYRKRG